MALTRAKKTEKVTDARQRARALHLRDHRHLQGAHRCEGFRPAQDRSRGRRQLPRRQEQAGRALRQGHQDRGRAAGSQGRLVGRLHLRRSRRARQGALHLGQGQRGVHLQAGHRRRQGHHRRRDQALATMPGKEELFSKLLFLIQSPAQRLATVINATGRDLAVVINQGVEKDKFAGARRAQRLLLRRLPRSASRRSAAAPLQKQPQWKPRTCRRGSRGRAALGRRAAGELHRIAGRRSCRRPIRRRAHNSFASSSRVRLSGRNGNPAG